MQTAKQTLPLLLRALLSPQPHDAAWLLFLSQSLHQRTKAPQQKQAAQIIRVRIRVEKGSSDENYFLKGQRCFYILLQEDFGIKKDYT
jgi:hypothetical protein